MIPTKDALWQEKRQQWLDRVDEDSCAQIRTMDEATARACFCRDIRFGTGGLRDVIAPGTARMNVYTVRRATQGVCSWMRARGVTLRAAIAYDSRHGSEAFARAAAEVFAANGVEALIFPTLTPTPVLSFAVREQGCGAGVCITASHNPAQYNGYKVYDADGCQITLCAAGEIQQAIDATDVFADVRRMAFAEGEAAGLIRILGDEVILHYLAAVKACSLRNLSDVPLKVVYTPLNGAGLRCVRDILAMCGVRDVHVVAEQAEPDGSFVTCPYPNPEAREALALGLRDCAAYQPDLLLATDPDCDRVGIAVRDGEDYTLLTGDEVGVLLMDYVCRTRLEQGTMPASPVVMTTIVSTAMADPIAEKYHVTLRRTLTGFKFIGEQLGLMERAGEMERCVFSFEESYGYLTGTYVRDKDGVNAVMLICEMARWYKRRGMTVMDALRALYAEFGCYLTVQHSYAFGGTDSMTAMTRLMERLRTAHPAKLADLDVLHVTDYLAADTGLPAANVLAFELTAHCRLMIRPSGTEPKLKVYIFTSAPTREAAHQTSDKLNAWVKEIVEHE